MSTQELTLIKLIIEGLSSVVLFVFLVSHTLLFFT